MVWPCAVVMTSLLRCSPSRFISNLNRPFGTGTLTSWRQALRSPAAKQRGRNLQKQLRRYFEKLGQLADVLFAGLALPVQDIRCHAARSEDREHIDLAEAALLHQ